MEAFKCLFLNVHDADEDTCEQFQTVDNVERSQGDTTRRLLCLPTGHFAFTLTLAADFDWEQANALQLLIDFDDQYYGLETFVLRHPDNTIEPRQLAFQQSPEGRRVQIKAVTQIRGQWEHRLFFETETIRHAGATTSLRKQGTIHFMVKRCRLEPSKRDHTPPFIPFRTEYLPVQRILQNEGIRSCVRLVTNSSHLRALTLPDYTLPPSGLTANITSKMPGVEGLLPLFLNTAFQKSVRR